MVCKIVQNIMQKIGGTIATGYVQYFDLLPLNCCFVVLKKELTPKIHIQYCPIKVAAFLTAYVTVWMDLVLGVILVSASVSFCHGVAVAFCCFYKLRTFIHKMCAWQPPFSFFFFFNTFWKQVSDRNSQLTDLHRLQSSVTPHLKLQALVYDILPSTTAVFSYWRPENGQLTSSFLLVLKQ